LFFSNAQVPSCFFLINTFQKLQWLVGELKKAPELAFDTETSHPTSKVKLEGVYPEVLCGLSFAWGLSECPDPWVPCNAAYIPLTKSNDDPFWGKKQNDVVELLRGVLESDQPKIAHNGKFDIGKLCTLLGIRVRGFAFDTMLAHSLINESRSDCSHALKSDFDDEGNVTKLGCSDFYLSTEASQFKDDLKSALKYFDPRLQRYSKVPIETLYPYGCSDSCYVLALKFVFAKMMEDEGLTWAFENIVMPLSHHILLLELAGMPVDLERAKQIVIDQLAIMESSQKEIWSIIGKEFNVGSNDQLGEILFDQLKPPGRKGEHHKWVVDIEALSELTHPVIEPLLKYRRAQKIQGTYVQPAIDYVREYADDGKIGIIHSSFFLDTLTGRLRSNQPNMTNLPKTENGGDIVKSIYLAPQGYKFIFKDFSQMELRMAAHLSKEPVWIDWLNNNEDLHAQMAHRVYHLPCDVHDVKELYKEQRSAAKSISFGLLYGESTFSLSKALNISYEEADHLINDEFFGVAKTLKAWIDSIHGFVKTHGFVTTMFGRRRHLPEAMAPIPQAMKWPDDSVRPRCYRDGPFPGWLGIDPNDLYNVSEFDIKQLIKAKGNMNSFSHCLSCNYIVGCSINRERKFVLSKVNGALRQAVNSPIQGGSAECASLAFIQISQAFIDEKMDASMVNYVHDELIALVKDEEVEKAERIMDYFMCTWLREFTKFEVPLLVDTSVCQRWSDKG